MLNEYEDNKQDLTLFLIELLKTVDLSRFPKDDSDGLKRYICVALRNRFNKLSEEFRYNQRNMIDKPLEDYMLKKPDSNLTISTYYDLERALEKLTEKQRTVFVYKAIYGFSIVEIGKIFNISRQAANKLYRHGTDILKEYY